MGGAAVSLGLILTNPLGGMEFPSVPSLPSIFQGSSATKVPAVSSPKKVVTKKALFEQGYDFEGVQSEKAKAAEAAADSKMVRGVFDFVSLTVLHRCLTLNCRPKKRRRRRRLLLSRPRQRQSERRQSRKR